MAAQMKRSALLPDEDGQNQPLTCLDYSSKESKTMADLLGMKTEKDVENKGLRSKENCCSPSASLKQCQLLPYS